MKPLAPLRTRYRVNIFIDLGLGFAFLGAALLIGTSVLLVFEIFIALLVFMTLVSILGPPFPGVAMPDKWEFTPALSGASEASQGDLAKDILRRVLCGLSIPAVGFLVIVILILSGDDAVIGIGFFLALFGALAMSNVPVLIASNRRISRWEQGKGLTLMYELGKLWRKSNLYSQSRGTSL